MTRSPSPVIALAPTCFIAARRQEPSHPVRPPRSPVITTARPHSPPYAHEDFVWRPLPPSPNLLPHPLPPPFRPGTASHLVMLTARVVI